MKHRRLTRGQADDAAALRRRDSQSGLEQIITMTTTASDGEGRSMTEYEAKFWDVGEEYDDATRKLVDDEVCAALAEYIQDGGDVSFSYRLGGSPIISFSVWTDNFDLVPGASFRRDLGDLLFEKLEESREGGPSVMEDLFAALFEVYERWRAERTASDPRCSIPVPELVDGVAIDRTEAMDRDDDDKDDDRAA